MSLSSQEISEVEDYLSIIDGKLPKRKLYKIQIKGIGCNAHCPMCDDWHEKNQFSPILESLQNVIKIISEEKIEQKMIYILGGEPLLIFNDLLQHIKAGKNKGIEFDFATNGSLLSEKKICQLFDAGLKTLNFSLDFPSSYHNTWRGLKLGFEKIIKFTIYAQRKGMKVKWNTVVGTFNISHIHLFGNLYNYCKPNWHDFICVENNGGNSKMYFLNIESQKKVGNILNEFIKSNKYTKISGNGFGEKNNKQKATKCFIPLKNTHYKIGPQGLISKSPCFLDPEEITEKMDIFTLKALTKGCNKCNSSQKANYNSYMEDLIRQYKLTSR